MTLWNGQEINVSQSPAVAFIKPTTSASYAVQKVVNECGAGNTGQAMRISLLEPLGVANQAESINLKAYPNPTNGEVYVEWTATAGQRIQLHLLNIGSNVLERRTVRSNGALQTELFNLSNLPAGVYIIQLITKSGEFSERLLKR